jgi:hypothetical protein
VTWLAAPHDQGRDPRNVCSRAFSELSVLFLDTTSLTFVSVPVARRSEAWLSNENTRPKWPGNTAGVTALTSRALFEASKILKLPSPYPRGVRRWIAIMPPKGRTSRSKVPAHLLTMACHVSRRMRSSITAHMAASCSINTQS